MPEAVDDTKAQAILESLRQLAARLQAWITELDRQGMARSARTEESPPSDLPARRAFILRYIRLSHPGAVRLKDLADQLGLSEDRAGHLVREACGQTFVALLNEARIRTAAALLRHSDFSVVQVALRAGFGDVSRFHRVFRAQMGITPHRYRRLSEQEHTRLMNSTDRRTLKAFD